MCIHDTLIPKVLELISNCTTKAKQLEIMVSQRYVSRHYESGYSSLDLNMIIILTITIWVAIKGRIKFGTDGSLLISIYY